MNHIPDETRHAAGIVTRDILKAINPDWYKVIGRLGGLAGDPSKRGFAVNRELASIVGKLGGSISRKGNKLPQKERIKLHKAHALNRTAYLNELHAEQRQQLSRLATKYGKVTKV